MAYLEKDRPALARVFNTFYFLGMQKAKQVVSARLEMITRNFLLFALFCFTAILSFTNIYNGDVWWSLAEGREIVSSGVLQNTNKFSFTFPDHHWISAQWLFSLTAYILNNLVESPV